MELKKKNLTMSMELFKWFENRASEMGITTSSLMVMAMQQYIDTQNALQFAQGGLPELMKKLEELKVPKQA